MLREPSIRDFEYMGEFVQEVNSNYGIIKLTSGGSKVGEFAFVNINRIWIFKKP